MFLIELFLYEKFLKNERFIKLSDCSPIRLKSLLIYLKASLVIPSEILFCKVLLFVKIFNGLQLPPTRHSPKEFMLRAFFMFAKDKSLRYL